MSYLIIRTNGTDYETYQIRNVLQECFNGIVIEEAKDIEKIRCEKLLEVYKVLGIPNCEKYIKERIAFELAEYLLKNDLVSFSSDDGVPIKAIAGEVIIVRSD